MTTHNINETIQETASIIANPENVFQILTEPNHT